MTIMQFMQREALAFRLLTAIATTAGEAGRSISYAPATWLRATPNDRNRARWSRLTRRMESMKLVRRHVDFSRDRVRSISITPEGWNWIIENCGAGAILNFDELCQP